MSERDTGSETLIGFMSGDEAPADTLSSGLTVIGQRYEILGLLGIGGMGSVYKVKDITLDEVVALKLLRENLILVPGMVERFRQEVKLARKVTHPNVVRTFDLGQHDGEHFLTMEYIEGKPLTQLLAAEGILSAARATAISLGICTGLSAAHRAGVLHRDLKPDNILVANDGRIVITDFGIARAAAELGVERTGRAIVGTPAYMAPEQVEPDRASDGRADLYALGAVLYEMVTGVRAWPGNQSLTVALRRLTADPPDPRDLNPEVPAHLAAIIIRCLARDPEDRFSDVEALANELAVQGTETLLGAPVRIARPKTQQAPAPRARTVAVLRMRAEAEDTYLAEGITEELIDSLSMTPGLRVRPLGAALNLPDNLTPQQAGGTLDVEVVVSGSVRRAGDNLRISIRLLGVEDGYQLWAHKYRTTASLALNVADEAAPLIAQALQVELDTPTNPSLSKPEAIDLYLRGKQAMRDGWQLGMTAALRHLEKAAELAPNHPNILAAYAQALGRQAYLSEEDDQAALLQEGLTVAERAVQSGPNLGEPWMALATAKLYDEDAAGAVEACREALQRAPGLARAHELLGIILHEAGHPEGALEHLETAASLDPTGLQSRWELARLHALLGNWTISDKLLDIEVKEPNQHLTQLLTKGRLGLWRGREPVVDLALMDSFDHPVARFGVLVMSLLKEVIRTRELSPVYAPLIQATVAGVKGRQLWVRLQFQAEIFAFVGDVERCMGTLTSVVDHGLQDVFWMDHCPVFGDVRSDPRFGPLREIVAERASGVG